jgi:hypothetical protein
MNRLAHALRHPPAPAALLIVAALCLCLPAQARAQWSQPDAGGNIGSTNTGNVGVGTTAPQARLDVRGAAVVDANQYFGFRRTDNAVRRLIGAADNGAGQHFVDIGQATAYITGIRFWPRDNVASPDVVINGSGYMGIGTTAPIGQLQVRRDHASTTFQNGTDFQLFLQNMNLAANNTVGFAFGGQRADGTSRLAGSVFSQMTSHANGSFASDLVFNVTGPGEAPLEGLRIKSSGNVGVNTANPASRLHVYEPAGNGVSARLTIQDADGAAGFDVKAYDKSWSFAADNSPDGFMVTSAGGANFFIGNAGNVGIGTISPAQKLEVVGGVKVSKNAGGTGGDLSVEGAITGGSIQAKYQDVAEWVPSVQKLAPGTVVVLDTRNSNHVLASTAAYDTKVAGVVSARPGIALGEAGEGKALVATTGRVKVRVDAARAPIRIGDLIVTSDVEGVAMRSEPVTLAGRQLHAPGTIIGKALEPLGEGRGEILVLLSLQ